MDQCHTQEDPLLHAVHANADETIKMTFSHISLNFGLVSGLLNYIAYEYVFIQVACQLPCIGWIQDLSLSKYNSGMQQICYMIKAQPHTHKTHSTERQWRMGKPKYVFSVCVCLPKVHLQSCRWCHGAAAVFLLLSLDLTWYVFL